MGPTGILPRCLPTPFFQNFAAAIPYISVRPPLNIPRAIYRLASLTECEKRVLHWVAEGKSNWQIGQIVHCAVGTVKKHLQHIFRKLGVETRTAAAAVYLRANHLLESTDGG